MYTLFSFQVINYFKNIWHLHKFICKHPNTAGRKSQSLFYKQTSIDAPALASTGAISTASGAAQTAGKPEAVAEAVPESPAKEEKSEEKPAGEPKKKGGFFGKLFGK